MWQLDMLTTGNWNKNMPELHGMIGDGQCCVHNDPFSFRVFGIKWDNIHFFTGAPDQTPECF